MEEKHRISLKAFVIGAIVVVVFNIFNSMTPIVSDTGYYNNMAGFGRHWWWIGSSMPFIYSMSCCCLVFALMAIVNRIKHVFTLQDVAIILAMSLVGGGMRSRDFNPMNYVHFFYFFLSGWGGGYCCNAATMQLLKQFVPSQFWGTEAYWADIWTSNWAPFTHAINFAEFAPTLFFGMFLLIFGGLIVVFLMLIFRRLYLDITLIPYPMGSTLVDMAEITQPKEGKGLLKNKYFLIGFAITMLWALIICAWGIARNFTWPDWGFKSASPDGYPIYPIWDFTSTLTMALPWVAGAIIAEPWLVGWGTLLHMDVLVGLIIGWISVWVIVPILATSAGIWPWKSANFEAVSDRIYWNYSAEGGTLGLLYMMPGIFVAIALVPIIMNWSRVKPFIMGLFKEPAKELDPEKPISYRFAWIGIIGSGILFLAAAAYGGISVLPWAVYTAILVLLVVGIIRWAGEVGYPVLPFNAYLFNGNWLGVVMAFVTFVVFAGGFGSSPIPVDVMTSFFINGGAELLTLIVMIWFGATLLESLHIGKQTHVENRTMLKAVLIAGILSIFINSLFTFLWPHFLATGPNYYGASSPKQWISFLADTIALWPQGGSWYQAPWTMKVGWETMGTGTTLALVIFGFVLVLCISLARQKISWFRVSAAGIVLGMLYGNYVWAWALIALIIKAIVVRVGGETLFNEKLKPTGQGLMVGGLLGWFIVFFVVAQAIQLHFWYGI